MQMQFAYIYGINRIETLQSVLKQPDQLVIASSLWIRNLIMLCSKMTSLIVDIVVLQYEPEL